MRESLMIPDLCGGREAARVPTATRRFGEA
jgi:hypothetical protein